MNQTAVRNLTQGSLPTGEKPLFFLRPKGKNRGSENLFYGLEQKGAAYDIQIHNGTLNHPRWEKLKQQC